MRILMQDVQAGPGRMTQIKVSRGAGGHGHGDRQ
jgi:hypothetical protein